MIAGLRGVGRAWIPMLVAVALNAALQAAMTVVGVVPEFAPLPILLALASFAVLLAALGVITSAALEAAPTDDRERRSPTDARVTWGGVIARLRSHGLAFAGWTVVEVLAVFLGLLLFIVPGILVVVATPYVTIAALDGRRGPLSANFRTIAARPGRWLGSATVMAVLVAGAWLFAALNGFFVGGWLASLIVWLVFGVLAAWFQAAWAATYRAALTTEEPEPARA